LQEALKPVAAVNQVRWRFECAFAPDYDFKKNVRLE
jgi:hypothetical protein